VQDAAARASAAPLEGGGELEGVRRTQCMKAKQALRLAFRGLYVDDDVTCPYEIAGATLGFVRDAVGDGPIAEQALYG